MFKKGKGSDCLCPFLILEKMNITSISEVNQMSTPAKVNRFTGHMIVSKQHFSNLSETGRAFVLFHEQGHVVLQTKDEIQADNYAIDYMLPKGYSLREILHSAQQNLREQNPVHKLRLNNIFSRMAEYDYKVNKNEKMKKYIITDPNFQGWNQDDEDELMSNFSLVPKVLRDAMKARQDRKAVKNNAKAQLILDKGQAKIIAAGGGGTGTEDPTFLEKAGGVVGQLFNKNQPVDTIPSDIPAENSNKTIYIIIGVVVVLAIVGAVVYFKMKKKK